MQGLINAKPKARRRTLEEAAGISGLYQRRDEAELKLKGAENNLLRVDDVVDQLTQQAAQLERQAKQAARYRVLGQHIRKTQGALLYQKWSKTQEHLRQAQHSLSEQSKRTLRYESDAQNALKARDFAESALPALRDEAAIANTILQRLDTQKTT